MLGSGGVVVEACDLERPERQLGSGAARGGLIEEAELGQRHRVDAGDGVDRGDDRAGVHGRSEGQVRRVEQRRRAVMQPAAG